MTLRIPESWVDEQSQASHPELFELTGLERWVMVLSWAEQFRWVAEVDRNDVVDDLADGVSIEQRSGQDGLYYRITGTRYHVFVQEREAHDPDQRITLVTSVKQTDLPGRASRVRPVEVRFAHEDERSVCDPNAMYVAYRSALQATRRRRTAVTEARRGLRQPVDQPRANADLRALVTRRYQPLRQMFGLLRQRSELEPTASAAGQVVGTSEDADGPLLWIDVPQARSFREKAHVSLTYAEGECPKLRIHSVEEGQLAVSAPRFELPAGTPVQVVQADRFALGRHSAALSAFLAEDMEGNWRHLAQLLCQPDQLPTVQVRPPEVWFDRKLNREQRTAVAGALGTPHCFHIQGPPGTGKTTVIIELVRQCVTRGERVLLLAPMHVALDEVLGRVADQPGVLALRMSWDEGRVREELRRYLPDQMADTYLRQARRPEVSRGASWRAEAADLRRRVEATTAALAARQRLRTAEHELAGARQRYERWQHDVGAAFRTGERDLAEALDARRWFDDRLPAVAAEDSHRQAQLASVPLLRRVWALLLEALALPNQLADLRTAARSAAETHQRMRVDRHAWVERLTGIRARLASLHAERDAGHPAYQRLLAGCRAERDAAAPALTSAIAKLVEMEGPDSEVVDDAELARRYGDLNARLLKLEHRIRLEQRWFEISGQETSDAGGVSAELRAGMLQSANLVCCTTTGLDRRLDGIDFDTMIVDEASRVIDSELLIGAVRAQRWIMVGDDRQLPPYVEPVDEQHLHALTALSAVVRNTGADLASAVDRLGDLWAEDEELHQFRTESVLRTAERLAADGLWDGHYRSAFEAVWNRLGDHGDEPGRTLLTALREHLVRSLFERTVPQVPPSLRQALRVQRRMIEPIAELVRLPVYGGAYETPEWTGIAPLPYAPTGTPIVFADTSAHGQRARDRQVGSGFVNDLEVRTVVDMCRSWEQRLRTSSGGQRVTVSVLTFYRAQATAIRAALGFPRYPDFRMLDIRVVDAIDKIQGQEADLVFLSFVRTHLGRGALSPRYGRWLQDLRRLNVACTRARRGLVLVGHAPTLRRLNGVTGAEAFYANLFRLLDRRADAELVQDPR